MYIFLHNKMCFVEIYFYNYIRKKRYNTYAVCIYKVYLLLIHWNYLNFA